jgi:hypothetical protein
LIKIIKENAKEPNYEIKYKTLFELTSETMEALSGILKLGKKKGIFNYDEKIELLLQGRDDEIIISLVAEDFQKTEKKYIDPEKVEHLEIEMDQEELKKIKLGEVENSICSICGEKVLLSDKVVDYDRILHQKCFKCSYCDKLLNISMPFSNLDGVYYCVPHYKQLFSINADYKTGFKSEK